MLLVHQLAYLTVYYSMSIQYWQEYMEAVCLKKISTLKSSIYAPFSIVAVLIWKKQADVTKQMTKCLEKDIVLLVSKMNIKFSSKETERVKNRNNCAFSVK